MDTQEISLEMLNAFVDGEVESEERIEILRRLARNPELTQRVCELIRTKELVRSAYAGLRPSPPHEREKVSDHSPTPWYLGGGALAASILLAVVMLGGEQLSPDDPVAMVAPVGGAVVPVALQQAATEAPMRIIFHLTSSNPLRMGQLLDNVELVLQQAELGAQSARVEVVANGEGMDLFRQGVSAFPERIQSMGKAYHNLRFVACQRTIDQIESSGEGVVQLLPGVEPAGSGISKVIERQQQGWSYIQI